MADEAVHAMFFDDGDFGFGPFVDLFGEISDVMFAVVDDFDVGGVEDDVSFSADAVVEFEVLSFDKGFIEVSYVVEDLFFDAEVTGGYVVDVGFCVHEGMLGGGIEFASASDR